MPAPIAIPTAPKRRGCRSKSSPMLGNVGVIAQPEINRRDRTGWLGMEDSNQHMSF
jgi:hypothetical protein